MLHLHLKKRLQATLDDPLSLNWMNRLQARFWSKEMWDGAIDEDDRRVWIGSKYLLQRFRLGNSSKAVQLIPTMNCKLGIH